MYYYTVQPGDTLYDIASYFGVQVSEILAVNPGINPYYLYAGQELLIPIPGYRPYPGYQTRPVYPIVIRPPFISRTPPRDRDDHGRPGSRPGGGSGGRVGGPSGQGHGSR